MTKPTWKKRGGLLATTLPAVNPLPSVQEDNETTVYRSQALYPRKYILTGAIAAALLAGGWSTSAQAQEMSNSERLKKLEQAVGQLQEENANLKAQIHSEVASEISTMPAGKLNLSTPVTEMKLYGDLMLCYRVNEAVAAGLDANDTGQKNRLRYRLRLGSDIKVTDGWSMGVVLETGSIARGNHCDPLAR